MSETEPVTVVDASGLAFRAVIKPTDDYEGDSQVLLQLEDGAQFLIPKELLVASGERRYNLRLSLAEYAQQAEADLASTVTQKVDDTVTVPVVEETLRVDKRTVERGRVQVNKRVLEREETVDVPLMQEVVEVERTSINRLVDEPTAVRYEGDTTVIPLFKEVLVVTKQLMLVEEVRVTKRRSEHRQPQQVMLRREEVTVERNGSDAEES
ncbi:MAG: hypothetical protein AVDCRST_MAG86-2824 [uncultured Truepera sp.]|uniref:DUF2382 domain-containing protein n=1 Tax=uncultured Truepera sp. TaxID=543023 RepID=A0A6J4VL22_9DEIN|nr:MAG: hypothetical protein AVDCRST_MAG86-2824 [uncultured Truepera sp.]